MTYEEMERMLASIAERQRDNQVSIDKLTQAVTELGKASTTLQNVAANHDAKLNRIEEGLHELVRLSRVYDGAMLGHEAVLRGHENAIRGIEQTLDRLAKLIEAFVRRSSDGGRQEKQE
ncbi:MAG: hypothetical protein HYS38_03960 [Acidobacteria bacterium]|nr:hypothetical protein [Acidobacteriota bacterium]